MAPPMDPRTDRPDEPGLAVQAGGRDGSGRVPVGAAPAAGGPMRLPLVGSRTGSHSHMGGLAAILVDGDRAEVAPAALHAKSRVEQGVRWVDDPAQVPAGRQYWVVWIAQGGAGGRGIRGAVASPMWIDRQAMVGYKHLAGHVNDMSRAMKGVVDLSGLTAAQRRAVGEAIRARAPQVWAATDPAIRAQLGGEAADAAADPGDGA
ncbi:YwhD family protein [Thermaerobacter composti]|uniref:YwhD family protein n=1 Tax=Thermaerobacter composti TaxID=554949 RepID=A0ABZ0QQQ8_9FIRM|nr:YwhD family protein [Thermaerobacter composti]WPD19830.1 YwhD family protein [Thermaerobacter composti]